MTASRLSAFVAIVMGGKVAPAAETDCPPEGRGVLVGRRRGILVIFRLLPAETDCGRGRGCGGVFSRGRGGGGVLRGESCVCMALSR